MQAARDENNIPTLIGASSDDGTTPITVYADPDTHGIAVDDNTTGSDNGRAVAYRDDNGVPVLLAVSSDDGVTPIEVYVDPVTHKLLIDSA